MHNLKLLRKKANLLQKDIAKVLNVSVSTYSYWENGVYDIDLDSLSTLANYYNVSIDYLLGKQPTSNLTNETVIKFPVIGKITAGYGGMAVEEFLDEFQEVPKSILKGHSIDEYMVMQVVGDSMYPQFLNGDNVLVLKQPSVDSGDIAVIIYNGDEATIKKVVYNYGQNWLEMVPTNPMFQTVKITGEALQECMIVGKVVYLFRKI